MPLSIHIIIPDCPQCGAPAVRPSVQAHRMAGKAQCGRDYSVLFLADDLTQVRAQYYVSDVTECIKRQLEQERRRVDALQAQNTMDFEHVDTRRVREIDKIIHTPDERIDV